MPVIAERGSQVYYAPGRIDRLRQEENQATSSPEKTPSCVFCPGNEILTPPEVWTYNNEGNYFRDRDSAGGWEVRVVPNKFPLVGVEDHEVIIVTPDHAGSFSNMSERQIEIVLFAHRERIKAHQQNKKDVVVFANVKRPSGASQDHLHTQLVTLNPGEIEPDNHEMPLDERTIVATEGDFVLYCPEESEFPFEMVIQSRRPIGTFGDLYDEELKPVATLFRKATWALENNRFAQIISSKTHREDGVPYNFYIKKSRYPDGDGWCIRFNPRLTIPAGFEQATGRIINIVPPQQAAEVLRETLEQFPQAA
ncbi:hypothetical protein HY439_03190 [Candidatus Microgenomates bacterium]|nr:hypothetical protein [Candidatus Microgenomates bacterium]